MKIGFFDSGFGGLNILSAVVKEMPEYDYVYLGDTARTPYGSRSQDVIYEYTKQAVEYLFQKDCQLIILACNSASSEALPKIQQNYLKENYPDRRVLGVIVPAAEEAVSVTKNNNIGVIATESTVESNAFSREVKKINKTAEIHQQACPLIVPLVESGETDQKIIESILFKYLEPIQKTGIDTLILGCTHYGILEKEITEVWQKISDQNINIINEGKVVAQKLRDYLKRHPEIESKLSKNNHREFYTTDLTEKFQKLGSLFFGQNIEVKKINLESKNKDS